MEVWSAKKLKEKVQIRNGKKKRQQYGLWSWNSSKFTLSLSESPKKKYLTGLFIK
jgi:hypothetical protein